MPLDQGSKAKLIKQVQKAIKGQESRELVKGSDQAVRLGPLASNRRTFIIPYNLIRILIAFSSLSKSFQNGAVAGEAWYQSGGHWNHPFLYRETNAHWRVQEAGVVTTHYRAALEAAAAAKQNTQPPPAEIALVADDSGIESLHAHDEKEPTHAIAATLGMRTITIKSGVLAVLSHFYGLSKECPYAFLEEFYRYCDIQPMPAGSTSEDYRLKDILFVLKGDAGVWLSRMPEGSIRTWAEFRMIFLDHFFPASKTSALKREITETR
ncbi:hypothetical protein SASPL_133537 [Salvia splendens]|uniref:Retrotransposon gag domain-containing protein n=1 Tax=Salvia splendens TaxID=180675 RepID=A0A8X8ZIK1_SALSN|nr:hypothetical protein SASPL_133537 [Salvia splendens]